MTACPQADLIVVFSSGFGFEGLVFTKQPVLLELMVVLRKMCIVSRGESKML